MNRKDVLISILISIISIPISIIISIPLFTCLGIDSTISLTPLTICINTVALLYAIWKKN